MTTCKKCGTPLDSKIQECPICHTTNPGDKTIPTPGLDLTENYNPVGQDYELVRLKSRKVAVWLAALIGFTGAPFFYLAFWIKGLKTLLLSIFVIGLSLVGYFLVVPYLLFIGIGLVVLVQLWTAFSIGSHSDFKDGRGELLK